MSQPIIDDFLDTHHRLFQAIEGLDESDVSWKASPSSWSVTEVLGHLADHSIVVSFRIRAVLAGSQSILPAFDQEKWVTSQHSHAQSAASILAFFQAQLTYNGALLQRLEADHWQKSGIHPQGNPVTITDIVKGFSAHVDRHIQQIDRIKAAQVQENSV
ncbi:DinB family protein [Saccharibacillus sp. JS10]|uniref:DinB family protein n=1 Tax=Saccharibacillus sp. JS10 TaxID=2950552 RepID=UPI0021092AEC|nr:DinB family protein [Saccharibacillus sp. JS10]MCQ4086187.1 DinB family protein [Saccharibacillus sp. JS10]